MRQIGLMKVSKAIENVITTKVYEEPVPYQFRIYGTPGGGTNTYDSALAAWKKLKEWSEKEYAEAELLENNFYWKGKQSSMYLLVKITDPTAAAMERIIKERQERNFKTTIKDEWLWK